MDYPKMVYTIITRRRDGYMNQKVFVNCEIPDAVIAAKIMVSCDKSDYAEIYQDRVPKGDLWGKPVAKVILNKDGEVDFLEH